LVRFVPVNYSCDFMTWFSGVNCTRWILAFVFIISLTFTVSASSSGNSVTIIVKDAKTKENPGSAQVYLDGSYLGITSSSKMSGTLIVQDIDPGTHTVRVTSPGYNEVTKKFIYPDESSWEIILSKGSLVSLNQNGPSDGGITIVFYPSSTSYNCTIQSKVPTPVYLTNETRFREDVTNVINQAYLNMDTVTSPSEPLPNNFREKFNFYYYYDPALPADAFSGCAGTVPDRYWKEVPFSDVTVILYPGYYGIYANSSCQPTGCNQDSGPGHNLMKAPADQLTLIKHETGHAIFGLIDTYCGETYYSQNDPHSNVWASSESCKSDARSNGRDPEKCRQIQKKNSVSSQSCTKNFWQWDPNPDIMANGYKGSFGAAATQRINYILSQSGVGTS
jgi:hypothetical protein